MNTKLLPKEYTDRKKKIIELHETGMAVQEIKKLTKTHPSVIKRIIEKNESEEKTGMFNVNKHDCWFIPTSYNY
jgi:DNA invertase Pin-like site-specific DNA recombinase